MPILVFLAASVAASAADQPPAASSRCGSYCLYVALRALDLVQEPYSSFEKRLPPPPPAGYSFHDLEQFAGRNGAHTLGIEANLDTLSCLEGRRACIAYLDQHFVIVSSIDEANDKVSIIDPPGRYDRTLRQFRQTYSRRALIIATEPVVLPSGAARRVGLMVIVATIAALGLLLAARFRSRRRRLVASLAVLLALAIGGCRPDGEAGGTAARPDADPPIAGEARPGLRIEPLHYHAGTVFATSADHKIHMVSTLFNDTDDPIRITELRKSCTCTAISLGNSTIAPHGRTSLNATFSVGNKPGRDAVTIAVFTSLPGDPGRQVACDWDLVTPLHAIPDHYGFGRLDLGTPAAAQLELWNRGIAICRRCEVQVEGVRNLVAARFEADPRAPRVDRHTEGDISPGEDRRLGTIILDLRPQSEEGDITRLVDVIVRCGGIERGKVSIPVDWSIRPRIEVRPARLWLGLTQSGKSIEHRLLLHANDGGAFRIVSVATKSGPIRARGSFPAESGVERFLDLTLVAPERSGIHRGELEITTERDTGARRIILPVSLIVRRE